MATANKEINKTVDDASSRLGLYAKKFSFSSLAGAACGVAARRLSVDALYGAGMCIAFLQGLAYMGYISINWNNIGDAFTKAADQNADGKLDFTDVKIFVKRLLSFLSQGFPDAAGFSTGFFVGFKYFTA